MKLSIIIVSYNVSNYLRQCLLSIFNSIRIKSYEIIIVDNYSYDNTCEMIATEFPSVRLIKNETNLGFSKAANIGINNSKGEYICILNPDTLIGEDTFFKLINFLKNNPKIGCVGPKILNPNGSLQLSCKRSFPKPLSAFYKLIGLSKLFPNSKLFAKYNLTYLDANSIHSVDSVSGSFMLIPKYIFKKIGLFDESFFMYGEDLDLCYRIKLSGFNVVYNPSTQIIHYKGESVNSSPFDMVNIFYKSMYIFYEKYTNETPYYIFMRHFISIGIYFRKIIAYCRLYFSKIISTLIDLSIIIISFIISIIMWYKYYYSIDMGIDSLLFHWPLLINLIISWLICSYILQLYKKNIESYSKVVLVTIFSFLLSSTSTYFISVIAYSRAVLLITFILTTLIATSWRIFIYLMYRYGKVKLNSNTPLFTRKAIILGTNKESLRIGKLLNNSPDTHFILLGYIDNNNKANEKMFLGRLENIRDIIKLHKINEIVFPEKYIKINELINFLNIIKDLNVQCKFVPTGKQRLIGKGVVENLSGLTLMDIELPIFDKMNLILKRFFDIFFSSLIMIFTFPVFFYYIIQHNYGSKYIWTINGKKIKIWFFNSKYQIFKELPLIFNILKGQLSFVGSVIVPVNLRDPNLKFKPGLTGLAHLKSYPNQIDSTRQFDNYYALNHSLTFDVEILFKTIFKI